ncbi:YncE family protein [Seonamhaeicola sp. ML3]|uniref:YncE family protein n=1 Tax=Seonamhaeicola sp. ML3 TaxID=2937786 RepID=UPI00200D549B|nr:YncE family protein [Seonamhaeicola sp. ML3]
MRYLKLITVIFCLFFISALAFYFIKQPSYDIKTEGTLYVVNKASKDITVFNLREGKEVTKIFLEQEPHEATVLVNQNKLVVTNYGTPDVEGKSITVIDTKNNTIEQNILLGEKSIKPHGIISLPELNKVAVVTDVGNDFSVVNIESGVVEKRIATQQDFSHLLVHHPKKQLMYVANIKSGSVSVIDIVLDKVLKIIPIGESAEGIDVNPDGSEVWVTNIKENLISVIDTETNEIANKIDTGKEPLRLKFSVDGRYCLVSNSGDGTISVYNGNTKELVSNIVIPGKDNILDKLVLGNPRPVGILMHPNGQFAFVSNLSVGRVEVIDMKSFKIVSSIEAGAMPDGLALLN